MTAQRFCCSGEKEYVKGGVHGAACAISAVMAVYNLAAWYFRREGHLSANAFVYTLASAWEVKQTMRHLRRCQPVPAPAPEQVRMTVPAPVPEQVRMSA